MDSAVRRLDLLAQHLTSAQDIEVVICGAFRTPLTKSGRGGLKTVPPEGLLLPVMKKLVEATGVNPAKIDDICIGNVLATGAAFMLSRMCQMLAGIPYTTSLSTCNRLCSSGLQACANIANSIKAGHIEVGVAGGVENMSMYDMTSSINPDQLSPAIFEHETARDCMMPMGMTSENVVEKYGITRQQQDQMAVESHAKAARAQETGLFDSEIVPVEVVTTVDGKEKKFVVSKDDGIRKGTTMETLAKLKPAFKKNGSTTAGNSSQVSDGAAVVLLASRAAAERMGLPILARWVGFAVGGVPPSLMGIGPSVAIPKVLEQCRMTINDIDIFEVNEAFASQATYCVELLRIPKEKLNPKGGAIAFGHPLGCTGARQMATILPELRRTRKRFGLLSMCIGTGMGAAAIIENLAR
jgi:acetyl-CoA acyltransferase 1